MPKLSPYKIVDLSEGILQGIANTIVPQNSVYLSVNFVFDKKIGYAIVRDGITQLGDTLSGNCNGLYNFITASGTVKLLAAFTTNIYSLETATWTSRTAMANSRVRFLTFADTVLAMDGTNKKTSADGTTWVTTGGNLDVDNMPLCKYGITWKDKVYLAGGASNLDRVHFSSLYGVPDAGKISWTDTTAGYMDVDPEDGAGGIVGLGKVPGYLLIFKKRSIHRWDGNTLTPESLINIGAQSQEGITRGRESIFFWNERGVYETNGGYPRKVSRRIQDIIDAVSASHTVIAWSDTDKVYFDIGDITVAGLALKNCVICFNIDRQTWELYSYNKAFKAATIYIPDKETIIAGDSTGKVFTLFSGNDDAGTDIEYHLQFQNIEVGHRSRVKDLSEIIVFTRNIKSGILSGRSEEKDYQPLGNIREDVESVKEDISGRYIDLRISGVSKSGPEIKGIEIPSPNINTTT